MNTSIRIRLYKIQLKNHYEGGFLNIVFASVLLLSIGLISHYAFADTVTSTISVGSGTGSPNVNPVTNMIYVANSQSDTVSVIDGSSDTVIKTIATGASPVYPAINPITNMIYVTNNIAGSVSVINGTTNDVVNTINLGASVGPITANPNTGEIYVDEINANNIVVIDGTTNTVINNIPVNSPVWLQTNPATNMIYAVSTNNKTVSVIDGSTDSVVDTITMQNIGGFFGINPATSKIYVCNPLANFVTVIDGSTNTVLGKIPVPNGPTGLGVNPATNKIYVADIHSNAITVIDGSSDTVVDTISVGTHPAGVAANSATNKVYVTYLGGNTVTVIQGSTTQPTTSQLQVNSQDSFGNTITGFLTKLYAQNGTQIDSGYTPNNFTLGNGQTYTVHVGNYVKYKFNHWLDTGSTNANRTISITSDTSITAVYATIPTHPSNLTATAVSPSEIDLSWNAPSSDGGSPVTGYRIQSSTDGSTWTTIVKNTGNTNTAYSDTGLSPDTTYYYRVFALNAAGSSYRSNIASATTPDLSVAGTNVGP